MGPAHSRLSHSRRICLLAAAGGSGPGAAAMERVWEWGLAGSGVTSAVLLLCSVGCRGGAVGGAGLSLLWAPDLAPMAALGCELHQCPSLLRGQMSPALTQMTHEHWLRMGCILGPWPSPGLGELLLGRFSSLLPSAGGKAPGPSSCLQEP